MNEWINLADMLHVSPYSGELKVALIVIGWTWSNMGVAFKVMCTGSNMALTF